MKQGRWETLDKSAFCRTLQRMSVGFSLNELKSDGYLLSIFASNSGKAQTSIVVDSFTTSVIVSSINEILSDFSLGGIKSC